MGMAQQMHYGHCRKGVMVRGGGRRQPKQPLIKDDSATE
jgi:hypothetical protein